jgi:uncharacterized membrane protein
MSTVEKTVDVNVPISAAYNQWTQFESFPRFMEGVKSVRQVNDKRLHWHAEIAGVEVEWDADITEQLLEHYISWRSVAGPRSAGTVYFEPLDASHTRITLRMTYETAGPAQKIADWFGILSSRVQGDLERFKEFMESRGIETGAWRGEIHDGKVVKE